MSVFIVTNWLQESTETTKGHGDGKEYEMWGKSIFQCFFKSVLTSTALHFPSSWQTLHFNMDFVSWKSQNDWHCSGDVIQEEVTMWAIGFITLFILSAQSTFFSSQYVSMSWRFLLILYGSFWAGLFRGLWDWQQGRAWWEHQKVGKYWTCANENKSWQPITVRRWQAEAVRNVELFWTPLCPIYLYPHKTFISTSLSPRLTSWGHWWV